MQQQQQENAVTGTGTGSLRHVERNEKKNETTANRTAKDRS